MGLRRSLTVLLLASCGGSAPPIVVRTPVEGSTTADDSSPSTTDDRSEDAVVHWLDANAIPVATPDPGHGLADLAPLGEIVGDAHVVALGEATHGTREFFQLEHRMLEYLVAEKGFTVFAIEASMPERSSRRRARAGSPRPRST